MMQFFSFQFRISASGNQLIQVLFLVCTETAEDLWKGVVSVSNAGKKKGRGKRVGRKKQTDLNKGQIRGTGNFFTHILKRLVLPPIKMII